MTVLTDEQLAKLTPLLEYGAIDYQIRDLLDTINALKANSLVYEKERLRAALAKSVCGGCLRSGYGIVLEPADDPNNQYIEPWKDCPTCGGTGKPKVEP